MLAGLGRSLKQKKLYPIDRLGVVRDAFALAESGDLPTARALDFAKNFRKETDYNVWLVLAFGLGGLGGLARNLKNYPFYEKFALGIFGEIVRKAGWKEKRKKKPAPKFY